jgi:6,7-dimethyl-8-ribityllumazine synthase
MVVLQKKIQIGKTLVIVTAEFNENATETLEEKVKSLILRHISDQNQLAISSDLSEHVQ